MMKRVIALLGVVVLIVSCEKKEQEVPVSSVSITQATAEMIIGETIQLSATVSPSNATEKSISWASSKVSVATVANGRVTAVAEGTSTITASCGGKSATCQITVSKGIVAVTSISLNKESVSLIKGESETLIATVKPDDATDKTVTWSSSEAAVASVDNSGKVTAVAGGSAVITAKAGDKQATCTVTVTVPIESITLDRESVTLEEDGTTSLVATVKPDDATDKTVIWSSSDSQIATVDETGKVTAIKEGEATITAAAGEKTASCKVTVNKRVIAVESVSIDKNSVSIFEGESTKLIATVKPDNASDKTVTWSSSDTQVASVNENGLVSAVKEGSTTITAKAGDKTAECKVIVESYNPNNIKFADSKVKEKLVAAFDTNHDGNLSYEEAAAVTSADDIKAAFGSIKTYKSFDEFQYFTGINRLVGEMFSSWDLLTSIKLPMQIQIIDKAAFKDCIKLSTIVIPEGVVQIEDFSFSGCTGLTSITIPASTTIIGRFAFENCSGLTSVSIPEGVKIINENLFWGCTSLTSVSIPESVEHIYSGAFGKTYNLTNIYLNSLASWLKLDFSSSHPFDNSYSSGHIFLSGVELYEVTIPEGVSTINYKAFFHCSSITKVNIPESVTSIRSSAFQDCTSLASINIPESATSIGSEAFQGCTSLASINIPESVTSIGSEAFQGCTSLASINIPESVTSIGLEAFQGCTSLASISIPESITIIGRFTFSGCSNLQSISIPESVTTIEEGAFSNCESLKSIMIPDSVEKLGSEWISGCRALESVTLPNSITVIPARAFFLCESLSSISIPESVTFIGDGAFNCCISLKALEIPKGVIEIGLGAFIKCSSLQKVLVRPVTPPKAGYNLFYETDSCTIYVPKESVDAYKEADNWKDYSSRIQAIE